jgi:hypothetical protein
MSGEEIERVIQALGPDIGEGRGLHAGPRPGAMKDTGGMTCRPYRAQGWRGGCAPKHGHTSGRAAASGVRNSGRWYDMGALLPLTSTQRQ